MVKIKPIILTGLGTTPESESDQPGDQPDADCGMLGIAEVLRTELPTCTVLDASAISWSVGPAVGIDAVNLAIQYADLSPGDFVVMQGHSFGNNLAAAWSQSPIAYVPPGVRVIYVGHDPCHEIGFKYPGLVWRIGSAISAVLTHLQRKGRPFGVSGTPFLPFRDPAQQVQIDVSNWQGPPLAHIDCTTIEGFPPKIVQCTGIVMDDRVRAAVYAVCRGAISGKSVQQVIDELSAKWLTEHKAA